MPAAKKRRMWPYGLTAHEIAASVPGFTVRHVKEFERSGDLPGYRVHAGARKFYLAEDLIGLIRREMRV